MNPITELSISADAFELGEILSVEDEASVTLETMVPLGDTAVPLFRVHGDVRESFEESVRQHSAVSSVRQVSTDNGESLYALDWTAEGNKFISIIKQHGGHVLEAKGDESQWFFKIQFPAYDVLSEFQEDCFEAGFQVDVRRIYNPTEPGAGRWYGLTAMQRETIVTAVENGYYALPRGVSTKELGERFDVSDQAVTERLRRAIETLVTNTLMADTEQSE